MKFARSLCFLVVSVSLSGFAATKDKETKMDCNGPKCGVTVTIKSCTSYTVSAFRINVGKGNKPEMTWTLVTPGWSFTDDGIEILTPGGEFEGKVKHSGTVFKWKNKNTKPGEYKYNINVTDGKQVCKYDPWIVNL